MLRWYPLQSDNDPTHREMRLGSCRVLRDGGEGGCSPLCCAALSLPNPPTNVPLASLVGPVLSVRAVLLARDIDSSGPTVSLLFADQPTDLTDSHKCFPREQSPYYKKLNSHAQIVIIWSSGSILLINVGVKQF